MVKGDWNRLTGEHKCEEDISGDCYECGISLINTKKNIGRNMTTILCSCCGCLGYCSRTHVIHEYCWKWRGK